VSKVPISGDRNRNKIACTKNFRLLNSGILRSNIFRVWRITRELQTSNDGHCRGISVFSVIGALR
jgi:hypothetical protein